MRPFSSSSGRSLSTDCLRATRNKSTPPPVQVSSWSWPCVGYPGPRRDLWHFWPLRWLCEIRNLLYRDFMCVCEATGAPDVPSFQGVFSMIMKLYNSGLYGQQREYWSSDRICDTSCLHFYLPTETIKYRWSSTEKHKFFLEVYLYPLSLLFTVSRQLNSLVNPLDRRAAQSTRQRRGLSLFVCLHSQNFIFALAFVSLPCIFIDS